MPNLQFSPAPSHGNAADREKENGSLGSSSSSSLSSPVGVGKGNGADISPRSRPPGIGTYGGRAPLERISSESTGDTSGAPAPVGVAASGGRGRSGGGVVACTRNSSCTCPDCAEAASAFGIDQLRMVGARPRAGSADGTGEGVEAEPAVTSTVTHSPFPKTGAVAVGYSPEDAYNGTGDGNGDVGTVANVAETAVEAAAALPVYSPPRVTTPTALGAAQAGARGEEMRGGEPREAGVKETGVAEDGFGGAHDDGCGGVLDDLDCDRVGGGAAAVSSDCAVGSPGVTADNGELHA